MTVVRRLTRSLQDPAGRRWSLAITIVVGAHIGVLLLMASQRGANLEPRPDLSIPDFPLIAPIYVDLTPLARTPRAPPVMDAVSGPARSNQPPVVVRPTTSTRPSNVAPLPVPPAPPEVRSAPQGRVIPQSWRERCGLGDGPVSDADWAACRDGFLQAAAPGERRPLGRQGDPSQDFAAQGAANIARYEYYRSPAPTGSGNARPSSTPGSNFGWGEMDSSVVYGQGGPPQTMGRED